MRMYRVEQGDYLSKIAKKHGFNNWRTIYEHPDNAAFRDKRPDPNLIFPGDEISIPDKEMKLVSAETGKCHVFRLQKPGNQLRVSLVWLYRGEKVSGRPYRLEVEGTMYEGTIPSNAVIEHPIPPDAENGRLEVDVLDGGASFVWDLKIGHLDPLDEVTGVQQRLTNLELDPGPIDGIDGPRTRAAVRAFQQLYGLTVDGVAGPRTKEKLREVHGC